MTKKYTGSLTLDWFNKQKSILIQPDENGVRQNDVPAPKMNWINKEEALFYQIVEEAGLGLSPYWVGRGDLRVKEARPFVFEKAYKAVETGLDDKRYRVEESTDDDAAVENMLIRGDNLLALNALKKLFANRPDEEKVKCIFIDPPYNTGSAFEQYDDNLAHSEWLTLMRDRLEILKSLLREDGSIWITLDDTEAHYCKVVCDEVFGRSNFLCDIAWEKRYSPPPDTKDFGYTHDHILCYRKSSAFRRNLLPLTEDQEGRYKNPDNDPRGPWKAMDYTCRYTAEQRPNLYYPITQPKTKEQIWPKQTRVWAMSKEVHQKNEREERIWWGADGRNSVPALKNFLSEINQGMMPMSLWRYSLAGHNQDAKKEAISLFPDDPFSTPKPEKLLHTILHIGTSEGELVLDCFGGSGTTFAVAQKMGRRWIGVEIGKHAETYIIPRLKKVLSGEDQAGISKTVDWKGGGSFKYYKLGDSIIDHDTLDFNWKLGSAFLEQSLLSSYDFAPDPEFSLPQVDLVPSARQPSIGFHRVGQRQMAGVVSLVEPSKDRPITYDELMTLYSALKAFKGTQSITVFTNRGIELAYDSKPDDLEVIKVPHAIFAELEK